MEDNKIVDLYWERSENAIAETDKKYRNYCYYIAFHILHNQEDSDECVNDTYLNAWNAMPTQRPNRLSAFIGKITRNLSLNCWEKNSAEKRGFGQVALALDELQECISSGDNTEQITNDLVVTNVVNEFVASLSTEKRIIFMRRYWYLNSIAEIAEGLSISESKVKMTLSRTRKELRKDLEKEGIIL